MKRGWLTLGVLGLTACQGAPVLVGAPVPVAAMAIDMAAFESALAGSQSLDWSANTFASPRLLESRQARAEKVAGYKVSYTPASGPVWTRPHVGARVSNALAYAFSDPVWNTGPAPMAGDRLMYMTNAARGSTNFYVVNPATGAALNGGGWDVLATVGAPAGSRVDDSAITLSTQATQAMFVTTGGYFGVVETGAGAKRAGFALGAGRTTVRSAPFINNSAAPGIDNSLQVWVASTDATDATGRLHRFDYAAGTATPWTAAPALTVSGSAADGTGGVRTARGFRCSPVAWLGKVYIGDVAGLFWEVDIATGAARYWDLSPFSGVATNQILAPAAFDLSGAGDAVTKIFVSCGARVFWIDPTSNVAVPSQNLLVDTATTTPGPDLQGSLDGYTYTGSTVPDVLAADSISVGSTFNVGNPTIYGGEITGSDGLNSPTDGQPVSGYVRFNVPANAFTGRTPIAATLSLATDPYTVPDASDAGSIYRASNFLKNAGGQDTTTQWTGNNLKFNNQPRLLVPRPFSQRNGPAAQYQRMNWNVNGAVPRDGDAYTFVLRGSGKRYNGPQGAALTSPGYYGADQNNIGGRMLKPYLRVTCSNYGIKGAIANQPILLALGQDPRLYVVNSNALFELNYQDTGTFANAADTRFSLTASGRGGAGNMGVIEIGNKFAQNEVTTSLGMTGGSFYAYVSSENGAGAPRVNKFSVPFARTANADDLRTVFSLPLGSGRTTTYVTWDYFGGSLYFADQGTGTSTVHRLAQ
jgi:hypothetical protein